MTAALCPTPRIRGTPDGSPLSGQRFPGNKRAVVVVVIFVVIAVCVLLSFMLPVMSCLAYHEVDAFMHIGVALIVRPYHSVIRSKFYRALRRSIRKQSVGEAGREGKEKRQLVAPQRLSRHGERSTENTKRAEGPTRIPAYTIFLSALP